MDYQTLLVDERDGILEVVLNRPDARNAINARLTEELAQIVAELGRGPAGRVAILTGSGGAFCAGADLKEARTESAEDYRHRFRQMQILLEDLENLPCPVIAAINGAAVGGGLELAASCDIRIAAATARLGYVEVRVGVPAMSRRILSLLGPARAKELYFVGELVSATEAAALGLVNRVVAPDDLLPTARDLAAKMQLGMPLALRYTKQLINLRTKVAQEAACLALAEEAAVACAGSADRREALAAFAEKRRPIWRGD